MSAEPNGKTNWLLAFGAISAVAVLVAGAWVIIDQKVELAVLKTTKQDSIDLAVLQSRLVEIETQFRAEDQLMNVHLADEKRTFSLLWPRVFSGEQYPAQVYFPQIARDPK